MTRNLIKIGLAGLLSLGVAGSLSASVLLNVSAQDDIFLAGQASSPSADAGALPAVQTFAPVMGTTYSVEFTTPIVSIGTGITGTVTPCVSCPFTTGPDGSNLGSQSPATNVSGPVVGTTTTLSSIQYTGDEMFLVGVFLAGSTLPASQVASIGQYGSPGNTIDPTATSFAPLLGQTFFIGDGLTGNESGTIQDFIVPTGATAIYLGFADSMNMFNGVAGSYFDNSGSLNVNLQVVPFNAGIPEPGTLVLFGLGLAGLALGRKKLSA